MEHPTTRTVVPAYTARLGQQQRRYASAAPEPVLSPDEYIPFESPSGIHTAPAFSNRPLPKTSSLTDLQPFDPSSPLIVDNSLITVAPRFKQFNNIGGEIEEITQTLYACLQLGRFERAANLMRRLQTIYKPDAAGLLHAHNEYIRELTWKIIFTRDLRLLKSLQRWFEVELRSRGAIPNATTFGLMIQASLQEADAQKAERAIRRYIHLAEAGGLRDQTMNQLLAILNHQELGRVTRIIPAAIEDINISAAEHLIKASGTTMSLPLDPPSKEATTPEVRPLDPNTLGLKTLKKSLLAFSDPSASPTFDGTQRTEGEADRQEAFERQLKIEQDTLDAAISRWQADSEDLKRLGISSALEQKSIGALMWNWHQLLTPLIKEEIQNAKEIDESNTVKGSNKDIHSFGLFLQFLNAEKLSAITILTCMQLLSTRGDADKTTTIQKVVSTVGRSIHEESLAEYLKNTKLHAVWRNIHSSASLKTLVRKAKQKRETNLLPELLDRYRWSRVVEVRVGAFLTSKLIDVAKMDVFRDDPDKGERLREFQPAFIHYFRYISGKPIGMLGFNKALLEMLAMSSTKAAMPRHLPMIVEPKPWIGFRDGGYLSSPVPVVRLKGHDSQAKAYTQTAIARGDMAQVFAGLDVLSKTPWRINRPIFEVMAEAWNTGDAIANMAPENPAIELPPKPIEDDVSSRYKWMMETKRLSNAKHGKKCERCFQNFQLEVARAYLDETFYFPHNVDFRGRAYPTAPFLNHMGADLCRGLLIFGRGKELGDAGLRWLKIHLSNLAGFDKASFEDRLKFVDDNLDNICDSARNPLKGRRWWLRTEDPWQCLAACMELENALESPDPRKFVSHMPIHQDGSCNGLQHYAALGGDIIGAGQVNLEPGSRPADVYTGVADIVKAEIAKDAEHGLELAKILHEKVTRKVVKQTVMTNVYGVTFFGATRQIRRQLEDLYPDFPNTSAINYGTGSYYIASKVFRALANMFKGAHDIQYWLGDCAGRICRSLTLEQIETIARRAEGNSKTENQFRLTPLKSAADKKNEFEAFTSTVIWTTPLRMPVVHPYRKVADRRVSTNLQTIGIAAPSISSPVDKRRQLQAFPPNFIHSLDATHMILSALKCTEEGLTFAAVHDSFWTHASDVDVMNGILRESFIKMHSENIIGRLAAEFRARYRGSMHFASVKKYSAVGKKIQKWRLQARLKLGFESSVPLVAELLQERRRLSLLASKDPKERQRGKEMVTAGSIFAEIAEESDLAVEEDLKEIALGSMKSTARVAKLEANKQIEVGDAANVGDVADALSESGVLVESQQPADADADADVESNEERLQAEAEKKRDLKRKQRKEQKINLWLPISFPPVPQKGSFDVSRIGLSKYFFS
ncbi:MAG: hypothetical protein Q9167_000558 [Letrouitia subvulpina]